jgi:hypothetical protein
VSGLNSIGVVEENDQNVKNNCTFKYKYVGFGCRAGSAILHSSLFQAAEQQPAELDVTNNEGLFQSNILIIAEKTRELRKLKGQQKMQNNISPVHIVAYNNSGTRRETLVKYRVEVSLRGSWLVVTCDHT